MTKTQGTINCSDETEAVRFTVPKQSPNRSIAISLIPIIPLEAGSTTSKPSRDQNHCAEWSISMIKTREERAEWTLYILLLSEKVPSDYNLQAQFYAMAYYELCLYP